MRYHCVQCDQEFEMAEGEDKPRCPKCLRQHGLRPIESPKAVASSGKRPAGLVAALTVIAIAAGAGYAWWQSQARSAGSVVDADDLRTRARQTAGIDVGDAADLLVADAAIEAFAKRAAGDKDAADAKAQAIVSAIAARAKSRAFVPWSLLEPRETAAQTAAQAFAALSKDGARNQLYPLEVAAIGVAALRSQDVAAQLVDVGGNGPDRAPYDPSGRIGYYALAVPAPGSGAQPHVYDVYAGRGEPLASAETSALTDLQAVGAVLSLRALQRLVHAGDTTGALQFADAGTKLSPSSAAARGVRAAVLLATGGKDEGARELEAAAQLRPAAAQQNNLAMFSLAMGEADRAAKLVAQALGSAPDYAAAHLTLASVHLARLERDLARGELTQAERLDPQLPALPMAWAELLASSGEMMQAQAKAEEAVRARPKSPETHLLLARIHRQAGHYDAMRAEGRKVLELAPASQKDQITQVLRAVLGPTALEPTDAAEPGDVGSPAQVSVDSDTKQLDAPAPEPGNLQLGAGEPKLRLGGGSKLKLDLSH